MRGQAAVNAAKRTCINGHPFDDKNTYRKRNGQRGCRTCIRLRTRAYRHRHRNRYLAHARRWKQTNAAKHAAHSAVNRAVNTGHLKRPTECSACGRDGDIQAHHDDYSQPLDVRWLCALCHAATHRLAEAA